MKSRELKGIEAKMLNSLLKDFKKYGIEKIQVGKRTYEKKDKKIIETVQPPKKH